MYRYRCIDTKWLDRFTNSEYRYCLYQKGTESQVCSSDYDDQSQRLFSHSSIFHPKLSHDTHRAHKCCMVSANVGLPLICDWPNTWNTSWRNREIILYSYILYSFMIIYLYYDNLSYLSIPHAILDHPRYLIIQYSILG